MIRDEFYIVQLYHDSEPIKRFTLEAPTVDEVVKFVKKIRKHASQNKPFQMPVYIQGEDGKWFVFSETLYYQMGYIDQVRVFRGIDSDLEEIETET